MVVNETHAAHPRVRRHRAASDFCDPSFFAGLIKLTGRESLSVAIAVMKANLGWLNYPTFSISYLAHYTRLRAKCWMPSHSINCRRPGC